MPREIYSVADGVIAHTFMASEYIYIRLYYTGAFINGLIHRAHSHRRGYPGAITLQRVNISSRCILVRSVMYVHHNAFHRPGRVRDRELFCVPPQLTPHSSRVRACERSGFRQHPNSNTSVCVYDCEFGYVSFIRSTLVTLIEGGDRSSAHPLQPFV